jgi:hypothetical protein
MPKKEERVFNFEVEHPLLYLLGAWVLIDRRLWREKARV